MASVALTNVSMAVFALGGFPGLESAYSWIGIPVFSVYLVTMLGNCPILYIIGVKPSLNQPMYHFLAMLAATDLSLCVVTVPTVLGVLWFQLSLIHLASSDTTFNNIYALSLILLTMGSDLLFILISYSLILKTILGMASSGRSPLKALNTCVSHICAVLVFYIPVLGLSIVHRFGQHAPPLLHMLMGNTYILFLPLMNPLIYSIKTKEISSRLLRMLRNLWTI
ncbi:olfactory receptor 51V1-like [Python bivittatus]|uniref:Olfactory receptor 51V1-like n=1 Tax=Python bivittatus TaxID=176946 RepID=A0A9F3QW79_PYTBI|nr:olfactory receptor 51V1-like [Python bivittatus]